jgi:hypothetical protein
MRIFVIVKDAYKKIVKLKFTKQELIYCSNGEYSVVAYKLTIYDGNSFQSGLLDIN